MGSAVSLSTKGLKPNDSSGYWRDHIWQSMGMFDISHDAAEFHGSSTMRQIGHFTFACVNAGPHRLSRSHAQARGDDRRLFKLVVQHQGTIFLEQGDRRVAITPGHWLLYDVTRPFRFYSTEPTRQSAVLLRAEDLRVADLTPYSLDLHSTATGYSSLLRAALLAAEQDADGECDEGDIAVMTARLTRLALMEHGSRERRRDGSEIMRDRVEDYLSLHLQRDDLSIDSIANGLNCSKRYLHKVFQKSDGTLAERILERRLEACRQALTDVRHADQSVTDIAYTWGFSSLAYFSRVFKETYKLSPREYRAVGGDTRNRRPC